MTQIDPNADKSRDMPTAAADAWAAVYIDIAAKLEAEKRNKKASEPDETADAALESSPEGHAP